ncbi:hypothetical protein TSOC_013613, partial [Tetrabaena socialis]
MRQLSRPQRVRVCCSAVVTSCPKLVHKARLMALVGSAFQRRTEEQRRPEGLELIRKELAASVSWMGAVLPFANIATAGQAGATAEIYGAVAKALD